MKDRKKIVKRILDFVEKNPAADGLDIAIELRSIANVSDVYKCLGFLEELGAVTREPTRLFQYGYFINPLVKIDSL